MNLFEKAWEGFKKLLPAAGLDVASIVIAEEITKGKIKEEIGSRFKLVDRTKYNAAIDELEGSMHGALSEIDTQVVGVANANGGIIQNSFGKWRLENSLVEFVADTHEKQGLIGLQRLEQAYRRNPREFWTKFESWLHNPAEQHILLTEKRLEQILGKLKGVAEAACQQVGAPLANLEAASAGWKGAVR